MSHHHFPSWIRNWTHPQSAADITNQLTTNTNLHKKPKHLHCPHQPLWELLEPSCTLLMDPCVMQCLLQHRERQHSLLQPLWAVHVTADGTGRELADRHLLPTFTVNTVWKMPPAKPGSVLTMQIKTWKQRSSETKQKGPTEILTQLNKSKLTYICNASVYLT